MNMLTNYHCHSEYCDGKGALEEYVLHAISIGMHSLGFSSHCPVPFENKWSMKNNKLKEYKESIKDLKHRYKNKIQIYTSLEIDFVEGVIGPDFYKSDLDYSIGSVHYTGQFKDGTYLEIDGSTPDFEQGLKEIFNNDIEFLLSSYFQNLRSMISNQCPTIVGHIDKIKIHNHDCKFWKKDNQVYKNEMLRVLELIAERGCIIEVNTRGFYKKKAQETYPGPEILRLMRKFDIPVVINSDSHHPDELIKGYALAIMALNDARYNNVRYLDNYEWKTWNL